MPLFICSFRCKKLKGKGFKISNLYLIMSNLTKFNKRFKIPEKVKDTNKKGFWAYNSQLGENLQKEANTKNSLKYQGSFNPNKVNDYINPPLSNVDIVVNKVINKKKLNSKEKIIYQNYIDKKNQDLDKDFYNLEKFGRLAKVSTKEGRQRLLFKTLEYLIEKEDYNSVAKIYWKFKEDDLKLDEKLEKEFNHLLLKMESIIDKIDIIKLQMVDHHSSQPPLTQKEFKLDPFQKEMFDNIDNGISTIVQAPTGSGKTMGAGYVCTKGRTLYISPTYPLALQFAAYIEPVIGSNVPIISDDYKTYIDYDKLIDKLNKTQVVVCTPNAMLDYLPLITNTFDWIIFDEIHMIGKLEGSSMEDIARLFINSNFLALSATIGNVTELQQWFELIEHKNVEIIKSEKRFFNLQKHIYLNSEDTIERLHPLSMINPEDFRNGSVLKKELQPTPPDIWDLAMKLKKITPLYDLDPYDYFDKENRITLDTSYQYFKDILVRMCDLIQNENYSIKIENLISNFRKEYIKKEEVDIYKLVNKLTKIDTEKTPAILFQSNSVLLMKIVKDLATEISKKENDKYPSLLSERYKIEKNAKKILKQQEKNKIDELQDKKIDKMQKSISVSDEVITPPEVTHLQEPTKEFNYNMNNYIFPATIVMEWVDNLKKFFPNKGDNYHWLLILLWRGIGIYVKGLPEEYLSLVQSLACSKKLSIVFSDLSLVFGVSMPFRSSVILSDNNNDNLNSMIYHQMAGRAGRRGLDKEGNVIFVGYPWERVKELSTCNIPDIKGIDTMVYSVDMAKKLQIGDHINWDNIKKNFIHPDITNEVSLKFYQDITENISEGGGWELSNTDTLHHLHMCWKLRYNKECFIVPLILPEIEKLFSQVDPTIEKNQVDLAFILSHFINIYESTNEKYILNDIPEEHHLLNKYKNASDDMSLDLCKKIDASIYISILNNRIIELNEDYQNDIIRNRLYEFYKKVTIVQNYFYYEGKVTLTRVFGKLLTRLWWIYHMSSPLLKD